ncbi:MAG: ABC transporter substrate-binding protein, partial [Candidatus Dormibacteraceae bacterium]
MRPTSRRPTRWTTSVRFSALGVLAATVVACGGSGSGSPTKTTASAPGITASTITIGSTQPLTGPAAPGYSEIAPASNAYFQYVNAHGGVYGRKLKYI